MTSDPTEARRTFARIRESVQNYGDNSLDYFSNQYLSALTSFRTWYNRQPRADASFFNGVVGLLTNVVSLVMTPATAGAAGVISAAIQLIAQKAAKGIQTSRDRFADSLVRNANNIQSSLQRRLSGRIPAIIERDDPELWERIQERAYLGREWQSFLHRQAGLPQRGANYQVRLLSRLVYMYRRWQHAQHSASYRGIYSMGDPHFAHMRGRAEAEAHIESGVAIPRRLSQYARHGEEVEN